jgi:hypothetical protein
MGTGQSVLIEGKEVETGTPRVVEVARSGHIIPPFEDFQEYYSAVQETDRLLWGDPADGRRIVIYGFIASSDTAIEVQFNIMVAGAAYRSVRLYIPADGGANPLMYIGGWKLPLGASIRYSTDAVASHYVAVYGRQER